ncbi:hypothetical protein V8F06_010541 [Rhypophila decipiens]
MPDPILPAQNVTYNSRFQGQWFVDARACYRPPPDLQIPIVCYVQVDRFKNPPNASTALSIQDPGSDFMLFEDCCPSSSDAPAVYRLDAQCGYYGGPACFTTSEKRAGLWNECLQKQLAKRVDALEKMGDFSLSNMSRDALSGTCEYVDYERLKKGAPVLNPGRIERSGSSSSWGLHRAGGLKLNMGSILVVGVVLCSFML